MSLKEYLITDTCGPLMHNSPCLLGPRLSPVLTSTIFASVFGKSTPQDPGLKISSLVEVTTGAVSVIPQPSRNLTFGAFFLNNSINASPTGAAPTFS